MRDQFVGNIEGRDIHRGACDVIVTDGFVGNVVLKVCEGLFEFVMKMVAAEVVQRLRKPTRPSDARLASADSQARLQRLRRGAAAGHRRHLHHLPRQRRPGHQERPGCRRQVRGSGSNAKIVQELAAAPALAAKTTESRSTGVFMPRIAFLFPGQGAQRSAWAGPCANRCRRRSSSSTRQPAILGYDLLDLRATVRPSGSTPPTSASRPSYVASLAALESLKASEPAAVDECAATAGLSLGEYTALVFAGA